MRRRWCCLYELSTTSYQWHKLPGIGVIFGWFQETTFNGYNLTFLLWVSLITKHSLVLNLSCQYSCPAIFPEYEVFLEGNMVMFVDDLTIDDTSFVDDLTIDDLNQFSIWPVRWWSDDRRHIIMAVQLSCHFPRIWSLLGGKYGHVRWWSDDRRHSRRQKAWH